LRLSKFSVEGHRPYAHPNIACDRRDAAVIAVHPGGLRATRIKTFFDSSGHLIKTFYIGPGGWTDQQLPDGTIVLTAPTGHTYTTQPRGGTLFPTLAQPTGELAGLMA
jgi:hypothetical protein